MKIRLSDLRRIIREALEVGGLTLYHGTLRDAVPSILRTGLRAGQGWGGAEKPGVFLCASQETALYWAKMSLLKKLGRPQDPSEFLDLDEDQLAVLEVTVPSEEVTNVVPRQKSFNLPGDSQYVGSVPPQWIKLI